MVLADSAGTLRPCHLLVAVRDEHCLGRGVLAGVTEFVRGRDDVVLHVIGDAACAIRTLASGHADGAIVAITDGSEEAALVRTGRPCVIVGHDPRGYAKLPIVASDDLEVGRLVAAHYLERGFENFAVFTEEGSTHLAERREGFVQTIRNAGRRCAVGPRLGRGDVGNAADSCPDWMVWEKGCGDWLSALPKPVAVMAPTDSLASACVLACRVHGLSVPDEVSVIGVGDDERFCRTSRPELSSVRLATGEMGREAARLLLSLINGGPTPTSPILLPPADVVARESSGESAVSEPDVAAAVSFISKHIRRHLTVQDVVDHLAISRRTLERQFIEVLGRTPLEEIRRVRIRRAKQLLMETDLTLSEVARECGYFRHQRLANAFKAATGMTPSAFRARTLSAITRRGR